MGGPRGNRPAAAGLGAGRARWSRTIINGFGDRYSTIEL
jgi:hypothetical protein